MSGAYRDIREHMKAKSDDEMRSLWQSDVNQRIAYAEFTNRGSKCFASQRHLPDP